MYGDAGMSSCWDYTLLKIQLFAVTKAHKSVIGAVFTHDNQHSTLIQVTLLLWRVDHADKHANATQRNAKVPTRDNYVGSLHRVKWRKMCHKGKSEV